MTKLVITRGLPASGKSTWALNWVAEDRANRVRVNRDDIRQMLDNGLYEKGVTEKRVLEARDAMIRHFLGYGYEVVCDDTNLPMRTARDLHKLAKCASADFEIMEFTDVPVEVCIDRDYDRAFRNGSSVGPAVIEDMYDRYIKPRAKLSGNWVLPWPEIDADKPTGVTPYTGTPGAPKAVIFDIDGTLAQKWEGRDIFDASLCYRDELIEPIGQLALHFDALGYEIIFMSGRNDSCYDETRAWLADKLGDWTNDQPLFMRKQGDMRRDSVVKLELFDLHVRDNYDVKYSVDDRAQVVKECWRAMGITTLHIAEGNF